MTPSPDDPITLADACETIFGGKIRPATLRAEAGRGNLIVFRIGRRDFTTAALVRDMVKKCRDAKQPPGFTLTNRDANGSSATDQLTAARAALSQSLASRSKRSPITLEANISRPHLQRRQSSTS